MGILKGKVAVVTGSTSGIGLAYARAFAGAGANIVLGMGAPADVEKERFAIESDFEVKASIRPRTWPSQTKWPSSSRLGRRPSAAWMSS
jgi:3-hydroxybutyrate dehydrogenase